MAVTALLALMTYTCYRLTKRDMSHKKDLQSIAVGGGVTGACIVVLAMSVYYW